MDDFCLSKNDYEAHLVAIHAGTRLDTEVCVRDFCSQCGMFSATYTKHKAHMWERHSVIIEKLSEHTRRRGFEQCFSKATSKSPSSRALLIEEDINEDWLLQAQDRASPEISWASYLLDLIGLSFDK